MSNYIPLPLAPFVAQGCSFFDSWNSSFCDPNGPYGELFFFLLKKQPMVLRTLVRFKAVKACALVGLHMMAEEDSWRMDSGSSFSWSSSSENNMGNGVFFVIGLHGSGDAIALFLQDWEVAKVALSCHIQHWTCCAKNKTKLKGDVFGLVSERACRLSDKPL